MSRPLPILYVCVPEQHLAYLQMPKAGCTSIMNAMRSLIDTEHDRRLAASEQNDGLVFVEVHRKGRKIFDLRRGRNVDQGYFRFTFARNPYARFLSFWRDKVERDWDETAVGTFLYSLGLKEDMHPAEIAERLFAVPLEGMDKHMLPQHVFLCEGDSSHAEVDFIGHLEHVAEDWQRLCDRARLSMPLYHLNRRPGEPASVLDAAPDIFEQIRRFYRRDFELLGYSEDPAVSAPLIRGADLPTLRRP